MSEYGELEAGHESGQLEQLHQESGSEQDYNSQYDAYGQTDAAERSIDFETGQHVQYESPDGARYESTSYTSFESNESEFSQEYGVEASQSSHESEFFNLDALRAQFDSSSLESSHAEGPYLEGGESGLSIASN